MLVEKSGLFVSAWQKVMAKCICAKIFYVIRTLHKNSRLSLRGSPANPFVRNFLYVTSVIVYSFVRNVPNIQECWLAPVSLRGLTIKGVYEVSYNRCGQIIERVCLYTADPQIWKMGTSFLISLALRMTIYINFQ